jgi:hypothetical protein
MSKSDFDTMSQNTSTDIRRIGGGGSFVSDNSATQILRVGRESVSSKASFETNTQILRVNDNQSDAGAFSDNGSLFIKAHTYSNVSELMMNKDHQAIVMNINRPVS